MMDKSYWQKNPDCNSKRYINSRSVSKIQASITFMKNNKEEITTEEQEIGLRFRKGYKVWYNNNQIIMAALQENFVFIRNK